MSKTENFFDEERKVKQESSKSRKQITKRSATGYSRIVGKRKANQNTKGNGSNGDPNFKMSGLSSIKDRFVSFLNGESQAVRWLCAIVPMNT